MAELVGIWRSPKRREAMEPLESARVFENEGVEGCAHRRGGKRNVLFVAVEDLEALGVEPGAVKENFTVRGAEVMKWPLGQRLAIGDAEFEVSMICDPCELMETIRPGLLAEIDGRRGMLARVTKTGDVAVGDELQLLYEFVSEWGSLPGCDGRMRGQDAGSARIE
jgi:MOSC domain-containing protein YiiM